jgi:hypothetical protein
MAILLNPTKSLHTTLSASIPQTQMAQQNQNPSTATLKNTMTKTLTHNSDISNQNLYTKAPHFLSPSSFSQNRNHQPQHPGANTHLHPLRPIRTTRCRRTRSHRRSIPCRSRRNLIPTPNRSRQTRRIIRRDGQGSSRRINTRVITICFFIRGSAGDVWIVGTLKITAEKCC